MKQCPACDFSFPDFHLVCDFDGTDLTSNSEQPSLSLPSATRLRRVLTSPFFLFVVFGIALLASAVLIGYLDSVSQSASAEKPQSTVTAINNP